MIEGIESLYQQLADLATAQLPDGWQKLRVESIYYQNDKVDRWGGYVRSDGKLESFDLSSELCKVIDLIRNSFRNSKQPVWGQATFSMTQDGKFFMDWGYDDCDKKGDTIYSSEKYKRWVKNIMTRTAI